MNRKTPVTQRGFTLLELLVVLVVLGLLAGIVAPKGREGSRRRKRMSMRTALVRASLARCYALLGQDLERVHDGRMPFFDAGRYQPQPRPGAVPAQGYGQQGANADGRRCQPGPIDPSAPSVGHRVRAPR